MVGAAKDKLGGALNVRTAVAALLALTAMVLLVRVAWPVAETPVGLQPHRAPAPAMGHREAALAQQGQPTTAAEARTLLDHDLAAARARLKARPDWAGQAAIGDLLLA
jgi:hypothetical protein